MSGWWKVQKVKKAREGLREMAHIDDGTSVPQHVFMHLLKISLSGKIRQTMPRLKQRLEPLRDDGRNVNNHSLHTGKERKYCD